ncbi:MAG TPA: branched-chain amino acid ABC transporter permease [Conexibacter sp.]|nr:branched-chain amino acid ABC transporter permease [Conexibacter sp.]
MTVHLRKLRFPATTAAALLAIALVPAVLSEFSVGLIAQWLPLVVLAISLDLLWGENRIISFGHGAFFAGGGYVAGLLLRGPQSDTTGANYALLGEGSGRSTFDALVDALSSPQIAGIPLLAFVLPVVLCGLVGLLVGFVIFRIGSVEIYAPLVTLGVGVIAATVFLKLPAIGGSNGLSGIPPYVGGGPTSVYWFTAAWLLVIYLAYAAFRRSRAGRRWRAAGDDPIRLDALGADTRRLRAIGFAASTALAGLAGALYVGVAGFMSADVAGVLFSVQALIWLAVGGPGSLFAPLVGVLAVQLGQHELSEQLQETWQLLLGVLLIAVVLGAPRGLTGLASSGAAAVQRLFSRSPHLDG